MRPAMVSKLHIGLTVPMVEEGITLIDYSL